MAVDKLVDSTQLDTDLTAVANAIRTKGGTSAQLAFPTGFVSAVEAIPAGGGGGYSIADLASGAPSGEIDITGLSFSDYAFAYKKGITSVVGSGYFSGGFLFLQCSGITKVHISLTGSQSSNFFQACSGLKTVVMSQPQQGGTAFFNGCTSLEIADLNNFQLRANYFYNNSKLATIILRKSNGITQLENAAVLNIAHFKSGGSGGTIYAPSALISTYQSATNWSTINGYGTITWLPIEGSIYETQYADGTPIT